MSTNGAPPDLLRLENIDTYYGEIHILEGLNLEVREGELVSLLGGNASGKSTTLKTILGLVQPRNGSVEFRGEEVTGRTTSYRLVLRRDGRVVGTWRRPARGSDAGPVATPFTTFGRSVPAAITRRWAAYPRDR